MSGDPEPAWRSRQRLRQFLLVNIAGIWPPIIALSIAEFWVRSRHLAADLTLMVLAGSMMLLGALLERRGVAERVIVWLVTIAMWLVCLGSTFVTPYLVPLMVLAALAPLMLIFRFLGGSGLVAGLVGTVVVCSLVPAIGWWREQVPTDADQRLVADVAVIASTPLLVLVISLGLSQVYADLGRQTDELALSRQRLATAGNLARRELERDLHDGAQQRLVTLSVHLGLLRGLLQRHDTERAVPMLEEITEQMRGAISELRSLAQGIYPPLLSERGLVSALAAAARRSPIPCTLQSGEVQRYPQDVESAVYFCALEALQNAVKHSGASMLTLELRAEPVLEFILSDTGRGSIHGWSERATACWASRPGPAPRAACWT